MNEPLPWVDDRSPEEIAMHEMDDDNRRLREENAALRARLAGLSVAADRLLEVVEANGYDMGGKQSRLVASARKAMGMSYDADALDDGGRSF